MEEGSVEEEEIGVVVVVVVSAAVIAGPEASEVVEIVECPEEASYISIFCIYIVYIVVTFSARTLNLKAFTNFIDYNLLIPFLFRFQRRSWQPPRF